MLAALTIGVSMRIVGILLIAALMVLPVVAAQLVAWSVRSTIAISIGFGLAAVLVGLTVSLLRQPPAGRHDRPRGHRLLPAWRRRPPSSDADPRGQTRCSATRPNGPIA